MALVRNEGLALDALRGRAPRFVKFGPDFPSRLEGSTMGGAELDRWLVLPAGNGGVRQGRKGRTR